jgi:hypothetical protein
MWLVENKYVKTWTIQLVAYGSNHPRQLFANYVQQLLHCGVDCIFEEYIYLVLYTLYVNYTLVQYVV